MKVVYLIAPTQGVRKGHPSPGADRRHGGLRREARLRMRLLQTGFGRFGPDSRPDCGPDSRPDSGPGSRPGSRPDSGPDSGANFLGRSGASLGPVLRQSRASLARVLGRVPAESPGPLRDARAPAFRSGGDFADGPGTGRPRRVDGPRRFCPVAGRTSCRARSPTCAASPSQAPLRPTSRRKPVRGSLSPAGAFAISIWARSRCTRPQPSSRTEKG
jgi:hypothetical protein